MGLLVRSELHLMSHQLAIKPCSWAAANSTASLGSRRVGGDQPRLQPPASSGESDTGKLGGSS